jgi:hypothetical protein
MEHQLRAITHIAQDVILRDHPSVPAGEYQVIPKPGSEAVKDRAYGCKVCGVELGEILANNLPCAGRPVDDMLAEWASDLAATPVDDEDD